MNVAEDFVATNGLRLQNDLRAFKAIDPILTFRAWNILLGFGLFNSLIKGAAADDLARQADIKNKEMFSCLLRFLVGKGILKFERSLFSFVKQPILPASKEFLFLYEHYARSMLWIDTVTALAPGVLASGSTISETGFGEKGNLDLWDAIMEEAPFSFRQFLIDKVLVSKKNLKVLDFGCGGGIGTEQMLRSAAMPISILGVDSSKFYLKRAENRIRGLKKSLHASTPLTQSKVRFMLYDYLTGEPLNEKFDIIYMSLVLNHITYVEQQKLISLLKSYLNEGGVLAIYQIINSGPFDRSPLCWVMHVVPSHKCYPEKERYFGLLKEQFRYVEEFFGGNVVLAKN